MIKMKAGGMILTGLAAFLVADKAVSSMRHAVGDLCEAAKWRGYYKCWSKGDAKGEPVPPGYSMTTRPDGANYEVVYDPNGVDHSHDNAPKTEESHDSSASVKAVCEAVKAVAEKAIDSLSKRSDELRGASEGQTEASESENQASDENYVDATVTTKLNELENAINSTFKEDGNVSMDIPEEDNEVKETDQDETVD